MPGRRTLRIVSICVFIASMSSVAFAATTTWVNPSGGNRNDAANWDSGVPAAGDDVIISGASSTAAFTVILNTSATLNSLTLGDGSPDGVQSLLINSSFSLTINSTVGR